MCCNRICNSGSNLRTCNKKQLYTMMHDIIISFTEFHWRKGSASHILDFSEKEKASLSPSTLTSTCEMNLFISIRSFDRQNWMKKKFSHLSRTRRERGRSVQIIVIYVMIRARGVGIRYATSFTSIRDRNCVNCGRMSPSTYERRTRWTDDPLAVYLHREKCSTLCAT